MAKPLRSQLNQIRAWVRQGRTDAWIGHQLEVSTSELREFRRRHGLSGDVDEADETDLRDEIEAEIAAADVEEDEEPEEDEEGEAEEEGEEEPEADEEPEAEEAAAEAPEREREKAAAAPGREREKAAEAPEREREKAAGDDGRREQEGGRRRRRRRRRRGGRRVGAGLQATFDHGDTDGYGLWLDPAVTEDPIYAEHWAGHRRIEVTLEPDRIVIKRVD